MKFVKGDAIAGIIITVRQHRRRPDHRRAAARHGRRRRGADVHAARPSATAWSRRSPRCSSRPRPASSSPASPPKKRGAHLGATSASRSRRSRRRSRSPPACWCCWPSCPGCPPCRSSCWRRCWGFAWRLHGRPAARAAVATGARRGRARAAAEPELPPLLTPIAVEVGAAAGARAWAEGAFAPRCSRACASGCSPSWASAAAGSPSARLPGRGRRRLRLRHPPERGAARPGESRAGPGRTRPRSSATRFWRCCAARPRALRAGGDAEAARRAGADAPGAGPRGGPEARPPVLLTDVLRRLVEEGISLRNLRDILGALAEWAPLERDPVTLTEHVRGALRARSPTATPATAACSPPTCSTR